MKIVESVVSDIKSKGMTKPKTKEKYELYYKFIEELYKKIKS